MSDALNEYGKRFGVVLLVVLAILASAVGVYGVSTGSVLALLDVNYLGAAIRLTVPIGFAAMGGIFAEKTGVINIGLEGLLIISAFTSVAITDWLVSTGAAPGLSVWVGFLTAVAASTFVAFLFAVVCIRYEANQIIAGLAIWLIALGFAPFASRILWESVNSPSVPTFETWTIPLLSKIPVVGPVLFDANPTVYMLLLAVPVSYVVLQRSVIGDWMEASGENPEALDTAGINVYRIRYFGVTMSGLLSGIGGAGLAVGQVGSFIGLGMTIVNGRGWIAITAYLIGNYTIPGAFSASFLFAGLDALQIRLQQIPGYLLPDPIIRVLPFIAIIIIISFVGRTRMPSAAGSSYNPGDE